MFCSFELLNASQPNNTSRWSCASNRGEHNCFQPHVIVGGDAFDVCSAHSNCCMKHTQHTIHASPVPQIEVRSTVFNSVLLWGNNFDVFAARLNCCNIIL